MLDTNDLLQVWRSKHALFSDVCVMCFRREETQGHLFLHCDMAWELWTMLFDTFGCCGLLPILSSIS